MIKKLFGETEEEQFAYLKPRLTALGMGIVLIFIGLLLSGRGIGFGDAAYRVGEIIFAVDLLAFGWAVMKGLFGIATVGALFSNNIIIGSAVFVLYLVVGSTAGIIVAVIGLCRFLVLLKKKKRE